MELTVQNKVVYRKALGQLLPRGSFWDEQLIDPQSDVSLVLSAQTEELYCLRQRMADLQKESIPVTSVETLPDWERVLLNTENKHLSLEQRKGLLFALQTGNVNIQTIRETASLYGRQVSSVYFPYTPACFGHSRFGVDRLASLSVLSVLFVQVDNTSELKSEFEAAITNMLLANQIVFFYYNTQRSTK